MAVGANRTRHGWGGCSGMPDTGRETAPCSNIGRNGVFQRRMSPSAIAWKRSATYRSTLRPWATMWVRKVLELPGSAMAAIIAPSPSCRLSGTEGTPLSRTSARRPAHGLTLILGDLPARKWTEVRAAAGAWLGRFAGETHRAAGHERRRGISSLAQSGPLG